MDSEEKERGEEWMAMVNAACDQIEMATEMFPGMMAETQEHVRFRLADLFGRREWTEENIDQNVTELLDDVVLKDVPASLMAAVCKSIADEIRLRQSD